ncbi:MULTISPECIES: flagellar export chaperone FliS [unclassified Cupriavidus]|uniref:flagellar export chaperone FliS n=1 Tax=unclassified Cupriavidus TaxID=2640874 RepID=UPI0010F47B3E|nr:MULTISPECIES: flagellar export chaperone FliS [unclassified Cupriavidus]MWL90382.1 flagellar export chaperone FliS [Cupriavidus sp. SW-Y-13]
MFARQGINAYAQVGVQTGVMSASPHKLIVMLYDGARSAIAKAKFHLENNELEARGNAISKAINIIDNGLRAVLDHEAGGEISANLDSLYDYMTRRLMLANLHSDVEKLNEVDTLLENLSTAWAAIDPAAPADAEQASPAGDAQPALQDS